jgi:hypothetical protein
MNNFPLYFSLKQKCENNVKTLSYEDQMELCSIINKELDEEAAELIFAIIRYYSIIEENISFDSIPYKPKVNKNGLKFDLTVLPQKLIWMIKNFVEMHHQKLQEERQREEKNSNFL